jgi:hypothetical protein
MDRIIFVTQEVDYCSYLQYRLAIQVNSRTGLSSGRELDRTSQANTAYRQCRRKWPQSVEMEISGDGLKKFALQ